VSTTSSRPDSTNATIAVACIATAMLMLDISVINTAISDIAASLETDLSGLQWVIDAYALPLAAIVLTAGALADRQGRRAGFLVGLAIFTVSSAACAAAGGIELLVAARAVQGCGAAIMFATALALIAQATPTREARGKALAIYGATIGAAFAIGPFIGGALVELGGWRTIFLINVPIGAVALWITATRVGEGRDPNARPTDWPGQTALIIGLFLLVFGLLRGNEEGWGSALIVASIGGSALMLAAFAGVQHRSVHPMLPLALFRDPVFAGAQIAVFAISSSFFAIFLYITLYLQGPLGLSPIETGLVYLPGTMLNFVVAGATASMGTRFSPARLTVVGLVMIGSGLMLLLLTQVDSSWTILLPMEFLVLFGTGLFNPSASAIALQALPEEQSGLAAGANDTFRQAGVALGIAGLGALVPSDAIGGDPQAYVDGLHTAAIVAGSIALLGAAACGHLLLRRAPALSPIAEPA